MYGPIFWGLPWLSIVRAATLPNQAGEYAVAPTPFIIDVNQTFIEDTRDRVARTRWPDDLDQSYLEDGLPLANATSVARFWSAHYNWTQVQHELNQKYNHYTTTVYANDTNYTEPVPLHFVHHRSNRCDAIPLLFVHGWPGSFLEVGRILEPLLNPPNDSLPAFHVVVPSIPGYGFSPAPTRSGFGPVQAASAFRDLMLQLNYTQWVTQGGDLGHVILQHQTSLYPQHVVSFLSNFWYEPPTVEDVARYQANQSTPDERAYLDIVSSFAYSGRYLYLHATKPLQLGYAITDSPLGFTMWMYTLAAQASFPTYVFSAEEIITWSMMYWIQGPYAGIRFYKEVSRSGGFDMSFDNYGPFGRVPYIRNTPVGITQRPYDIGYRVPVDWARRHANNVTVRYVHDEGGHFAAYQDPSGLLADIWDFFGNSSLSATDVFAG